MLHDLPFLFWKKKRHRKIDLSHSTKVAVACEALKILQETAQNIVVYKYFVFHVRQRANKVTEQIKSLFLTFRYKIFDFRIARVHDWKAESVICKTVCFFSAILFSSRAISSKVEVGIGRKAWLETSRMSF